MDDIELHSSTTDLEAAAQAYSADPFVRIVWLALLSGLAVYQPTMAGLAVVATTVDGALTAWAENRSRAQAARGMDFIRLYVSALERETHKLAKDIEAIKERIKAPEYQRVLHNFLAAGSTEAMDERQKMLAAAAAGAANVTLSIGKASRIERKLHELDPEDVCALWKIHRTVGNVDLDGKEHGSWGQLKIAVAEREGTDALDSTLLFRRWGGIGGTSFDVYVTETGLDLLTLLEEYLRERVPDAEIPGRGPRPGDRPERVVQKVIEDHAQLMEFIDRLLAEGNHAGAIYHAGSTRTDDPIHLDIYFRLDQRTAFVKSEYAALPVDDKELKLGYREEPIPNDSTAPGRVDGHLVIQGPHDVLRAIADKRHWPWYD